ncbi:MAG: sodium:calcium antiporter [Candidatus Arcticimaribacter sp.]
MVTLSALFAITLAMLIIWRSSDGFEVASGYLGRNLTDGVRGATINAVGSSIPELFTTLFSLMLLGEVDNFAFGIGTTAGSAIFNGMIIPAVAILAVIGYGIAHKVNVSRKVILRDGIGLIIAELILIYMVSGNHLTWVHGLVLMLTYVVYVAYMFGTMKKKEETTAVEEEPEGLEEKSTERKQSVLKALMLLDFEDVFVRKKINTTNAWMLLLFSMLVIGLACIVLIHSCELLSEELGIAPYFIAVVLASAATSVPDTILSYRDAVAGQYDDAVANALGSNIFDICFALGFPLFAFTLFNGPIVMTPETVANVAELQASLVILTIVAFLIYYFNNGLKQIHAFLLLALYVAFIGFIFAKAYAYDWAIQVGQTIASWIPSAL